MRPHDKCLGKCLESMSRLQEWPSSLVLFTLITLLNSPRWLNTVTGDETGVTSQMISTPSLPTQPMKGCTTQPGSRPLSLYEQQGGFFYVPQESEQWKSCETGPTVFRSYPRRLECLTICRCQNKGSTFFSVVLRPWVWVVRPGFEPTTYPIELTRRCLYYRAFSEWNLPNWYWLTNHLCSCLLLIPQT